MAMKGKHLTNVLPVPPRKPILTEFSVLEPVMTIHDVYRKYNLDNPKYFLVRSGYSGPLVEKPIKEGELFFVCCSATHKRMVGVVTIEGEDRKRYTFHPDTPFSKCQVMHKDGNFRSVKHMRLSDWEKCHGLPITVRFRPDLEGEPDPPCLVFNHSINVTNLLCNLIIKDTFDPDVLYVPTHLSTLTLQEVSGIQNKDDFDWTLYQRRFRSDISSVEYDMQYSTTDIGCYGELPKSKLPIKNTSPAQCYIKWDDFMHQFNAVMPRCRCPKPSASTPSTCTATSDTGTPVNTDKQPEDTYDTMYEEIDSDYIDIDQGMYEVPTESDETKDKTTIKHVAGEIQHHKKKTKKDVVNIQQKCDTNYKNAIPRAHAVGIVRKDASSTVGTPPAGVNSVRDVTGADDIRELNIDELCVYMQRLKLAKYCSLFRENMVDGAILLDLREQVLVEDFGFARIEAIRLLRFATSGHVPM